MNYDEARLLKPGDNVVIDPEWNRTEVHRRFQASGSSIISVHLNARSQTGLTVVIEDMHTQKWEIDVSWIKSVMKDP